MLNCLSLKMKNLQANKNIVLEVKKAMILEGSMLFGPYEILYVFDNG